MPITRVPLSNVRGQPNGIAGLDADGRVTAPRRGDVNILDSGLADPTGENSNDAAFAAAMAEVSANPVSVNVGGPRIRFPPGLYAFDASLQLKKTCIIEGDAVGQAGGFATKFLFPADTHGFIVHRHNTIDDGVEDPATYGGNASIIRNLELRGTRSGTTGHGIWLRARADIENVRISYFSENGLNIVANAGAGGASEGNANNFHVARCRISNNGRHGVYIQGADANAGKLDHVDCSGNDGWGIYDSSFLGNKLDTCHTNGNGLRSQVSHDGNRYYVISDTLGGSTEPGTDSGVWVLIGAGGVHQYYPAWVPGGAYIEGGAFKADSNNAEGVLDCCYSESGQPPSHVIAPWSVAYGTHAAGFTPGSTAFRTRSGTISGILSPFEIPARVGSSKTFNGRFCASADDFLNLEVPGDSSGGLSLMRWDDTIGCWVVRHANAGNRTPIRYTTDLNTLQGNRTTPIPAGEVIFAQGVWIGGATNRLVKHDTGTAPPAPGSGYRGVGDIRWNTAPISGGPAGWSCLVAGDAGTWNAFGTIA